MKKKMISFLVLVVLIFGLSNIMISPEKDVMSDNDIISEEASLQELQSEADIQQDTIDETAIKKPQMAVQSFPDPAVEILQYNDHEMNLRGYGNDTVRFNIEFRSADRAYFYAYAQLYDNDTGTPIAVSNQFYWEDWVDPNVIRVASIDICAYDINTSGLDGPYNVSLLFQKDNGTTYDIIGPSQNNQWVHITKPYLASDFVKTPITIAGITDTFIDKDLNSRYEWIHVNVTVDVTIPSNYRFYGRFQPTSGGPSDYEYVYPYLTSGTHIVTMNFAGWDFLTMAGTDYFNLTHLEISHNSYPYNGYYLLPTNPNYRTTSQYSSTDFDTPPVNVTGNMWDQLVDTDSDGDANIYRVTMEVDKLRVENGEFRIHAGLYINSTGQFIEGRWAEYDQAAQNLSTTGLVTITFDFNGIQIYKTGLNTDNLKVITNDAYFSPYSGGYDKWWYPNVVWVSPTTYSFSNFEGPGAYLTDNFNDYGDDTDGDTLYDDLVVEVQIQVIKAGEYSIDGEIEAPMYGHIEGDYHRQFYNIGFHWVQLRFRGWRIFRSAINDNLTFYNIDLNGGSPWTNLDYNNSVELSHYVFTQFNRPHARLTGIYSDVTADNDGDGLWDELQIHVEVEINTTGYYRVRGSLENPITHRNEYESSDLQYCVGTGTYSFIIRYPGRWIWQQRTNTTYILNNVEITEYDSNHNYIEDWDWNDNPFTTDYVYDSDDFDPPEAHILGLIDDYGIDLNSDGLFDRWRLVFDMLVMEEEITLHLYASLEETGTSNHITSISRYYSGLQLGAQNFTVDFRCDEIHNSGFTQGAALNYWYLDLVDIHGDWERLCQDWNNIPLTSDYQWFNFSAEILFIDNVWPRSGETYNLNYNLNFEVNIAKTPSISVFSVSITVNNSLGQFTYSLSRDYQEPSYEYWTINLNLNVEGLWIIIADVSGSDGLSDSYTSSFLVGDPPTITLFASSFPAVNPGGTIQFIVWVNDLDGVENASLIHSGMDHYMELIANISFTFIWKVNVTFNQVGEYKVYVRTWDTMGLETESEKMTIFVNEGPVIESVELSPGKEVDVGTTITFTVVILKSDSIITSVMITIEDNRDNSYAVALEKDSETEESETYTGEFTPEKGGDYVCRLEVMDTRNRVSSYQTEITVIGEGGDSLTPGFELIIALLIFTVLPIARKKYRR